MALLRDLFLGFVRLHVLYRAGREPVYGLWLIEEPGRHGYELSAGTLYCMLHTLEDEGFLVSEECVILRKRRKWYTLTELGARALDE